MPIAEDQSYNKITAKELKAAGTEFENCRFINCDLQQACLSNMVFIECGFENCNMVLCDIKNTGLQNITFSDCKLNGIDFSKARDFLFEVHFKDCLLDNAIFFKKKNKGGRYGNCSCKETDFTDTDLSSSVFENCNLHRAFFSNTILKDTDLSTSYNYTIDPDNNRLKKTKFSIHGLPGLLSKYDIVIK